MVRLSACRADDFDCVFVTVVIPGELCAMIQKNPAVAMGQILDALGGLPVVARAIAEAK